MAEQKLTRVRAAEGRTVPIPASVATAPGARPLFLQPGAELDVDITDAHIARRLRAGDLEVVLVAELDGGGPPAAFGDGPDIAKVGVGPHVATPKER